MDKSAAMGIASSGSGLWHPTFALRTVAQMLLFRTVAHIHSRSPPKVRLFKESEFHAWRAV
jgi:hypothetical protein